MVNLHTNNMYRDIQPNANFDWSLYDNGWNGKSLVVNSKVKKAKKDKSKIYCHENYAQALYKKYNKSAEIESKELKQGALVNVTDMTVVDGGNLLLTVNNGANNIYVDMSKESKFLSMITVGENQFTKESFLDYIKVPELKKNILGMNLAAKVETNASKASLSDGIVEKLMIDMQKQITNPTTAYMATIDSTNNGGYMVTVADTVKAFMPGSMAALNKITDFESLVGKTMEVMVENYDPKFGFVVSRKKYLKHVIPSIVQNFAQEVKNNPNKLYHGTVTGTTSFGIFVELTEYLTGMIHKTTVSEELKARLDKNDIKAGEELDVYVHKIENGRIIFSDIAPEYREAVIEKREAEEEAEKLRQAKADAKKSSFKNKIINR